MSHHVILNSEGGSQQEVPYSPEGQQRLVVGGLLV